MTGIRYISHPGTSGYAEAARRNIVGLARAGVPVTWAPVVPAETAGKEFELFKGAQVGDRKLDPFCNRRIAYDIAIVHVLPRAVPDCRQGVSAKTVVGYAAWDSNQLPEGWAAMYDEFDALLVPCTWNRAVFQQGGMRKPVFVIPHLFPELSPEEDPPAPEQASGEFIFYTIGDWTPRKNMEDLVDAYLRAFRDRDRVKLVIKTGPTGLTGGSLLLGWMRRVLGRFKPVNAPFARRLRRRLGLSSIKRIQPSARVNAVSSGRSHAPKIELITDEVPEREILRLHRVGDCFVSLTKGEGWGLGAFDAAGHGNPVMITGIGGPLDYLDADSAYLLDYRLERVRDNSVKEWSAPGFTWAVPDVQQAARTMRHVYSHREEASRKGLLLKKRILERYNEKAVIQLLMETLSRC
jgi:glycosyltransferase involved in cell wall biosynthesis